ncbi:GNAT family N-acetyltransferase [Chitinibacteraceae bacterium HSL-7]
MDAAALTLFKPDQMSIARCSPLYCDVFNAAPWHDGWTLEAATARLEHFATFPRFSALAFELNHTPVALVLGWGERWIQSWSFHIAECCVHPAHQGQGLGRHLMNEFEQRLQTEDYGGIYLATHRQAPAFRFYETLAFHDSQLTILSKELA